MGRGYAVVLSFDPERLSAFQKSEGDALAEVAADLTRRGFSELLPGMYVGEGGVDAVRAVMAVQAVDAAFAWFAPCLRAARLLRIDEDGDLTIALK